MNKPALSYESDAEKVYREGLFYSVVCGVELERDVPRP